MTASSACWARSRRRRRCGPRGSRRAPASEWEPGPGGVTRADLDRLADGDGVSMASALRLAGMDPNLLADATVDPGTVHALVELHIEQGVVLETGGEPIGVVEAIAAPHDFRLTF